MRAFSAWVGVAFLPGQGTPPPVEVAVDNLEYDLLDPRGLSIEKGAEELLLSWPEKSEYDQIIVAAPTIDGPWVPLLHPIFKESGRLHMAVPRDAHCPAAAFYRLAKGSQLIDDFSDPSKEWWTCFPDPRKYTIEHVDGAMRISLAGSGAYSRAITGPFSILANQDSAPIIKDFAMSIDILDYNHANARGFGFIARAGRLSECTPAGLDVPVYMGLIDLKSNDGAGIYSNPPNEYLVRQDVTLDPSKSYRLIFTGVGQQLTLRLLDLEDLSDAMPPLTLSDWRHSQGVPALWINAGTGSCDLTVDNYIVVGTTL